MQETRVQTLVQEDPTRHGATKPNSETTVEPARHSSSAATTEAVSPRAPAPQQGKPLKWEACAPQLE